MLVVCMWGEVILVRGFWDGGGKGGCLVLCVLLNTGEGFKGGC